MSRAKVEETLGIRLVKKGMQFVKHHKLASNFCSNKESDTGKPVISAKVKKKVRKII